jgi:hypothetical protein
MTLSQGDRDIQRFQRGQVDGDVSLLHVFFVSLVRREMLDGLT